MLFLTPIYFAGLGAAGIHYKKTGLPVASLYLTYSVLLMPFAVHRFLTCFKQETYLRNKILSTYIIWFAVLAFLFITLQMQRNQTSQQKLVDTISLYMIVFIWLAVLPSLSLRKHDWATLFPAFNLFASVFLILLIITFIQFGPDSLSEAGGANHLLFGGMGAIIFVAWLWQGLSGSSIGISLLFYIGSLMALSVVLFTGSRGALVSGAIGFMSVVAAHVPNKKSISRITLLSIIVSGALLLFLNQITSSSGYKRILDASEGTKSQVGETRVDIYSASWSTFLDHPLFGKGPQQLSIYSGYYHYPHNIIIEIGTDFGIFGLIIFIFVMLILLKRGWALRRIPSSPVGALTVLLLVMLIQLQFSGSYTSMPIFWQFSSALSLCLLYSHATRDELPLP